MVEEDEQDDLFTPDDPEPEPVSVASKRAYRKRKDAIKQQVKDAERFWLAVFETEIGRKEMWGVLQSAKTFEPQFACGPNGCPQPEATWFHAGTREFGQRLYLSWMKISPDGVMLMHRENDPRFARPEVKKND